MFETGLNWLLLAQTNNTADAVPTAANTSSWLVLVVIAAIFVLPIGLGTLIARLLKLKDLSQRISVVLFAVTLGIAPFAWHLYDGTQQGLAWQTSLKKAIRLGIDLKGGTNMIFEVDRDASEKEVTDQVMEQLVGAISKRINESGLENVTVRRVGFDQIEVIIPGVARDEVQAAKDKMTRLGSLEFAILANRRDHRELIARAEASQERDLREGGRIVASWREVGINSDTGQPKTVEEQGEVVSRPGRVTDDGQQLQEFLTVFEREDQRVTGQFLTEARSEINSRTGGLSVGFTFNGEGARRFYSLTRKNAPMSDGFERRLSILLDGNIHSAPSINEPIGAQGQITGQFSQKEINELISVLNAGALEVPIKPEPINELSVGPTLAADVQTKGVNAILIAAGVVVVFMIAYYWFAGIVAVLCLVLNLTLVMGAMASINATFTLPGLAGLVLTIGMAVDANVLIFERIREESARGSSLRLAIQNGFSRAFTTIVDANVTTLITAVVLYMIGTDQVRGFAVTLFIGILMSMFTALYFGRLMFDIFERKRWLSQVKMLSIVGTTHWDFISKKSIAAVCSALLIAVGMTALFVRGKENLDVDFTGGTMVTFEFVEPQDRQDVRAALDKIFESVTLERLTLRDENTQGEKGKRFRLRTTTRDADMIDEFAEIEGEPETVQSLINRAFAETNLKLRTVTVEEIGEVQKIPQADESTDENKADKDKKGETLSTAGLSAGDDAGKFAGGYRTRLTYSADISSATAQSYLEKELSKFKGEQGFDRYEDTGSLVEFIGEGSLTALAEQGKKYNQMQLQVTADVADDDLKTALAGMQSSMAANPLLEEVNSFAGSVAAEMRESAVLAMLASLIAIVAYIWFRFQRITFGLAAVAALVHDVLVVLGLVALASYAYGRGFSTLGLQEFKINLPMIAAFLTIVGYSLNDTIVIFDRIREVRGRNPALTVEMLNTSLNQTLARTLITSITTLMVVLILYAIGGEGIHGFAFCLVLGVMVGTYSSIFVASPALLWLMNRFDGGRRMASANR